MKNKVSIVITNFNRIDDLKETLLKSEDILYDNLEFIIVDNGSTDGSKEFIKSLSEQKYIKLNIDINKGSAYAHSLGMQKASGDFVVTIDDDCYLHPEVIMKTVEIFNNNSNLGAIGYGFLNPNINFDFEKYRSKIDLDTTQDYSNSFETCAATSGAAFRKSALEKIGYYDLNWFYIGEDVEVCMNLIAHGYNTVQISELIAYHKSSPVNRNFDDITKLRIKSSVLLKVKFYPLGLMIYALFKIFVRCIYFSILYRNPVYVFSVVKSLEKVNYVWANRTIINKKTIKQLVTSDSILFTR